MHISLTNSQKNGFKKWSDANADRPGNDDDTPGVATPIAVTEPPSEDREAVEEPAEQEGASAMRQTPQGSPTPRPAQSA